MRSGMVEVDQMMSTETFSRIADATPRQLFHMASSVPGFPQPYHISHRVVRWKAQEWQSFLKGVVRASLDGLPEAAPRKRKAPPQRRRDP